MTDEMNSICTSPHLQKEKKKKEKSEDELSFPILW